MKSAVLSAPLKSAEPSASAPLESPQPTRSKRKSYSPRKNRHETVTPLEAVARLPLHCNKELPMLDHVARYIALTPAHITRLLQLTGGNTASRSFAKLAVYVGGGCWLRWRLW